MGNGESRNSFVVESLVPINVAPQMTEAEMIALKKGLIEKKESVETRLQRYTAALTVSNEKLISMTDAFVDELHRGLQCWRDASAKGKMIDPKLCSFKMLDSFVEKLPHGTETGVHYAIDFGGTNLRAVRVELDGAGRIDVSQYRTSLLNPNNSIHPKGLMDSKATASELFDAFAKATKTFMLEKGDIKDDGAARNGESYKVGFTFSFPCSMRRLNSASLVVWTKNFETGRGTTDPVEGQDVGSLLNASFDRNNVPMKCAAVVNDTVGTLLSCAYERTAGTPQCYVGVILGTGFNACYYDETSEDYGYKGKIINLECGNFNRELPRTNVDMECDFATTSNRGEQLLEKMISGAYLGEIARRTIVKVWQHLIPERAWVVGCLTAEDIAAAAYDTSEEGLVSRSLGESKFEASLSVEQCLGVRQICRAVMDRSAALAACVVAACSKKTGHLQKAMGGVTVGVDGSLYKCNPEYREKVQSTLIEILPAETSPLIHLIPADDGSGKGAGIIASTADMN